eukprot:TRINITY_DN91083_c0_g1_i1.p1 TRINITY_DN91083_c0_g1~~TRINITY_DN91083_c0_g1_i1.p1  ORF type:complete len:598 (-),score=150.20 TRINITY_DN91083_c0_g1_i1:49-1842(-)
MEDEQHSSAASDAGSTNIDSMATTRMMASTGSVWRSSCNQCGNVFMGDAVYCRKCGQKRPEIQNPYEMTLKDKTEELLPTLLVEAGAIETRLREHVLQLTEPTTTKTQHLENKLKKLNLHTQNLEELIRVLKAEYSASETIYSTVEGFRTEMASWNNERHSHDEIINEKCSDLEKEVASIRKQLEMQASAIDSNTRGLANAGAVLEGTKSELAELRGYCQNRLDASRDKLMKLRDEFESKSLAAESLNFRLQDDVTRMSTTSDHVQAEVLRLGSTLMQSLEDVDNLRGVKADVTTMEEQQASYVEFTRNVDAQVKVLRKQLSTVTTDLKKHFQTAADVMTTSTSEQIDGMRKQYWNEIGRVDAIMQENAGFAEQQKAFQEKINEEMNRFKEELIEKVQALCAEAGGNVMAGMTDRTAEHNLLTEVQQLRKSMRNVEDVERAFYQARAAELEVVRSVLEGQMIALHLGLADEQDRKNIALFGYRPVNGDGRSDSLLPSITAGNGFSPRRAPGKMEKGALPPVALDKKCLGCSKMQDSVLAGFKIACLNYLPGNVDYNKVSYSRGELLNIQLQLLEQAQERLRVASTKNVVTSESLAIH